jgi:FlaA1/EpsC-like NDP-sugar epimerase
LTNTLVNKLIELNRITKQLLMMIADAVLIVFVLLSSFSIRLGFWFWPNDELLWIVLLAPVISIPVFISFKLYRSVVRYIGIQALASIAQAVTLYAVIWGLFGYMATIEGIPRSVILINWMLSLLVISGTRIIARWVFLDEKFFSNRKKSNVIIYGAGSAGRQLSHALQLSTEYKHVAYIDANIELNGTYINNIPIFSSEKIQSLVQKYNITEILLALPSISRKKQNEIIEKLTPFSVHVRVLPSVSDLAEGKVKIEDLLEIDIEDLLGREPVKSNEKLLKIKITEKVVLITGAGGSIGSELCRQIIFLKPKKLILFENSEPSLYQIEQELLNIDLPNIEIIPVLGSVRNLKRMKNIFNHYKVQTVYHAAAYKHVPLVEYNQSQGVLNNSIGTRLAAEAAIAENVETFVLISTDKAVRPTSTMGATKRIAELVLQALAKQPHNTCLTMVRFGNVLDSSGSVIPLFNKQIKKGGPVTVTDVNMVRYFMTIPEAVELVIQAGAMGKGGDVFVLDMGQPVKINDLAVKMIQLSGLQVLDNNNPDGDIEIMYTGLRPGEKLFEELLVGNNVTETENKLIMRAHEEMIDWENLMPILNELNEASINTEMVRIQELLIQLVPEYNPNSQASKSKNYKAY